MTTEDRKDALTVVLACLATLIIIALTLAIGGRTPVNQSPTTTSCN